MESTGNELSTASNNHQRYFMSIDTENTGAQRNKAHPFDPRNKCVALGVGLYEIGTGVRVCYEELYDIDGISHSKALDEFLLTKSEVTVGFNLKYDLHWIRRVLPDFFTHIIAGPIFDCQVAEFVLSYQQTQYPSLNETAIRLGDVGKLDIVATEYWDKGFDTDQVPEPILLQYLERDVDSTAFVFVRQLQEIKANNCGQIIKASMQDQKMLQEIEWNGQLYDTEQSKKAECELAKEMVKVREELCVLTNATHPQFNWSSPVQLRSLLYGGTVVYDIRVPNGTFKTGQRAGQIKYNWTQEFVSYPRLFNPPPAKKDKLPGTGKDEIKKLKATNKHTRRIKELLVLYSEMDQQLSLYYKGIPELSAEMGWSDGIIHGQLNQCVAVTGRLSSTRPNMQNVNKKTKRLFVSRF